MVKKYMTTEEARRVRQKYPDILRMSRPEPPADHPRMSLQNRAKIFSPFAALRGYEDEIADQNRVHDLIEKEELSDEDKNALSNKLLQCKRGTIVTAHYFQQDMNYAPLGSYCTVTGPVQRVDPVERILIIQEPISGPHDKAIPVRISFDDLMGLTSTAFVDIEKYLGLDRYPEEMP